MAASSDRVGVGTRSRGWRDEVEAVGRWVGVPVLVLVAVLTVVTAGAGLLITGPLDAVDSFDRAVAADIAEARTPALDRFTAVGGVPTDVVPVAAVWVGAMIGLGWWTRRWEAPIFLLVAVGGEKLTYLAGSLIVDRPRPPVPPLGHVFATSSFPSGHVASAVTLYGGLAVVVLWLHAGHDRERASPPVLVAGAVIAVAALTAVVALSRTYRGHHYVADVVCGALLGTVWLWSAWRLVLRRARPPVPSPRP
jgi:undecaprenyl-diphosphatase